MLVKVVGLTSIRTKLTRWRQYTQKESLRRLKDLPSIKSNTMMQTHFCQSLITGDGDAHNPVSGQVSAKAEDELFKYVVARCCARMQIVLSLK